MGSLRRAAWQVWPSSGEPGITHGQLICLVQISTSSMYISSFPPRAKGPSIFFLSGRHRSISGEKPRLPPPVEETELPVADPLPGSKIRTILRRSIFFPTPPELDYEEPPTSMGYPPTAAPDLCPARLHWQPRSPPQPSCDLLRGRAGRPQRWSHAPHPWTPSSRHLTPSTSVIHLHACRTAIILP